MGTFLRCTRLFVVVLILTVSVHAQDLWQGQSIYQIVTDRFFNGDVSNDNADGNFNAAAGQSVHGGDFKGIEQKLDYIRALGATAIWISPVVLNGNGDYHGYAGRDFYKVDPHFGSLADLKHLIDTAHAKGLMVIDDVVVNHGAQLLNSNDAGYPNFRSSPAYNLFYRNNSKQYAAPFDPGSGQSLASLFHTSGFIQNFNDPNQVENGSLEGLDDFRTENPYVRDRMSDIYKFWIDQGFDGFRVDTVKHVDHAFWQTWCPQIHDYATAQGKPNFFLFGEVYDGSETKVASYTGTKSGGAFQLDSALDYPLYFSIKGVFALANSNTKQIEDHYAAVDANYDPAARMRLVTFLDNHDQARFLNASNANNNQPRLNVALAFLYTARGIPCLYYGTEQGFNGGADPNDREDMFAGQFEQGPSLADNFNMTSATFQLIAKLNNLRRLYPVLRSGAHINLWSSPNGPGLFAFARRFNGQEVLVILNTATIPQTLPSRPSISGAETTLVNLLDSSETIVTTADGQVPALNVPSSTAKIFLAQSQALPLDPVVTSVAPAHGNKNVPTPSKIVFQFSRPMDTASVEAAFTISPTVSGTFIWSSAHDQLTFQSTSGLPELSAFSVRIGTDASDFVGRHLYASFESRFSTAQHTVQDIIPPTVSLSSPAAGSTVSDASYTPLVVSGTANDDVAVQSVEIRLDDGDWKSILNQAPAPSVNFYGQNFITRLYLSGPHTISARATDQAGNVSPPAIVHVKFSNLPGAFEQRIYPAGTGSGLSDCSNGFWFGERPYEDTFDYSSYGYIGGTPAYSQNTINGVCSQEQDLYRFERFSSPVDGFRYRFNCPPGIYEITLLEAETFMNGPNQRRFDVYIQGQKLLQNFDIFATAGGANKALTQTFTTNVDNAVLELEFKPVYDNARVSGIHVKKIGDAYSDTDGIADWWRLANFGHATGLADDHSRAQDDPDGDNQTNLEEFIAGTDPTDANSLFRITRIRKLDTAVTVDFTSVAGKTYQLQRSDMLGGQNWIDVGFPYVEQSTSAGQLGDPDGPSLPSPQFYRVIILQ